MIYKICIGCKLKKLCLKKYILWRFRPKSINGKRQKSISSKNLEINLCKKCIIKTDDIYELYGSSEKEIFDSINILIKLYKGI